MKVFHTEQLLLGNWKDGLARPDGQPLQCWWPEAHAAWVAAGSPTGQVVIRNRVMVDGYDTEINDGMRSSAASTTMFVLEVGIRE